MLRYVLIILIGWLSVVALYHTHKGLPPKLNYRSQVYGVDEDSVAFLHDLTYRDHTGEVQHEQTIFDTIFGAIDGARKYILIDMFLFNAHTPEGVEFHRDLSNELVRRLVDRKRAEPAIAIDVISDPINTVYGGAVSAELDELKDAGINVIITDHRKLRDSNFIYSSFWRTFVQWAGNSVEGGLFQHPFSDAEPKVSARSYLHLVNFKANHRKVFVADQEDRMVTIVSSANPHGPSAAHSNVALMVYGDIWQAVYQAEQAVAALSGDKLSEVDLPARHSRDNGRTTVSILTENQIKRSIIAAIESAGIGDGIRMAQFYLADRDIVDGLLAAAAKGADIKLVLDPNRDAFGYQKSGIPNRQVAHELLEKSGNKIQLRWYDTRGEQFHAKLFMVNRGGRFTAILGSANMTRRNLDNYNLELDIKLSTDSTAKIAQTLTAYFSRIWSNEDGDYTVEFDRYRDTSRFKTLVYRLQEGLGISIF